jgi:hypothetical protein
LLILLLVLAFDPSRCAAPTALTVAADFSPLMVITEGKTAQGFPYLSGGVGAYERKGLEQRGKAFNVKLAFAERRGACLADVRVVIGDGTGGEIVSLTNR